MKPVKRSPSTKPGIHSQLSGQSELAAKLKEAEEQARKFAESCVALEKAGSVKKATAAKANCLRWLTVERDIKRKLEEQ